MPRSELFQLVNQALNQNNTSEYQLGPFWTLDYSQFVFDVQVTNGAWEQVQVEAKLNESDWVAVTDVIPLGPDGSHVSFVVDTAFPLLRVLVWARGTGSIESPPGSNVGSLRVLGRL